jgi:hypothetical protein
MVEADVSHGQPVVVRGHIEIDLSYLLSDLLVRFKQLGDVLN